MVDFFFSHVCDSGGELGPFSISYESKVTELEFICNSEQAWCVWFCYFTLVLFIVACSKQNVCI